MATIKTSGGAGIISGSVGGTVFKRGQGGQVLQGAPRRIARQHPAMQQRRNAFSRARIFCGDIERAGKVPLWRVYAMNHPCKNCIGERRLMTWRHWAMKFNTIRYFNNVDPILDPPND